MRPLAVCQAGLWRMPSQSSPHLQKLPHSVIPALQTLRRHLPHHERAIASPMVDGDAMQLAKCLGAIEQRIDMGSSALLTSRSQASSGDASSLPIPTRHGKGSGCSLLGQLTLLGTLSERTPGMQRWGIRTPGSEQHVPRYWAVRNS